MAVDWGVTLERLGAGLRGDEITRLVVGPTRDGRCLSLPVALSGVDVNTDVKTARTSASVLSHAYVGAQTAAFKGMVTGSGEWLVETPPSLGPQWGTSTTGYWFKELYQIPTERDKETTMKNAAYQAVIWTRPKDGAAEDVIWESTRAIPAASEIDAKLMAYYLYLKEVGIAKAFIPTQIIVAVYAY